MQAKKDTQLHPSKKDMHTTYIFSIPQPHPRHSCLSRHQRSSPCQSEQLQGSEYRSGQQIRPCQPPCTSMTRGD